MKEESWGLFRETHTHWRTIDKLWNYIWCDGQSCRWGSQCLLGTGFVSVLIASSHTGSWQFLTAQVDPASLQWQRVQESLPNTPLYRPCRGIGNILTKFRFSSFKFRLYCNAFVIKQELKKKSERVKACPACESESLKGSQNFRNTLTRIAASHHCLLLVVKPCPDGCCWVPGRNICAAWAAEDCIFTCVHRCANQSLTVILKVLLIGDNASLAQIVFHKGVFSPPFLILGGVGEVATTVVLKDSPLSHACCTIVEEPVTKGRGQFWWTRWNFQLNLRLSTSKASLSQSMLHN